MKNTIKSTTIVLLPMVIITALFFQNQIKTNPERSPAVEQREVKSVKSAVFNYLVAVNNVK